MNTVDKKIKFRVWSLQLNRFVDHSIVITAEGKLKQFYVDETGKFSCFSANDSDFAIQEWVGTNDIEGRPIYLGDLVQLHTAANYHASECSDDSHYGLYEVYFDRAFKLKELKPNWFFKVQNQSVSDFNIIKVVGNIFEGVK